MAQAVGTPPPHVVAVLQDWMPFATSMLVSDFCQNSLWKRPADCYRWHHLRPAGWEICAMLTAVNKHAVLLYLPPCV